MLKTLPEFPDYGVGPVISEPTLAGSSGGVGVTAEALRRRNDGFHLQHLNSDVKSTASRKLIRIFEETPVKTLILTSSLKPVLWSGEQFFLRRNAY
jgi:hypothetical protein